MYSFISSSAARRRAAFLRFLRNFGLGLMPSFIIGHDAQPRKSLITEIFSPHSEKEFLRILKPDGRMIMVIPLENHLLELKQAVYDKAYKNEPSSFEIEGFKLLKSERVEYTADIACTEDIKNLFAMTPYYYKTGEKEQARLNTLQRLNVTLSFAVLCYGL